MLLLRRLLDPVYLAGAWLAGGLLILLCGLVLWSVAARVLGVYAAGATDVAGYVMATSTFMALAYTFRTDGHIRVMLLLQSMPPKSQRVAGIAALGVMTGVAGFLALYMTRLAIDSHAFGERSEGADAILLWIPQTPVAAGSILFALAVAQTFAEALAGTPPPARTETGAPGA